ncbi:hypothetical protein [Musicola keenii]|uniref:hypothetical protein n=1 Tax=Musicola keenii TaxID=2884250 RepID=UPI00177D4294|nr:hypothetical protein [Musicola keenii]
MKVRGMKMCGVDVRGVKVHEAEVRRARRNPLRVFRETRPPLVVSDDIQNARHSFRHGSVSIVRPALNPGDRL